MEAVKQYITATKNEGPDHKRGPIHIHEALSFLEALALKITDEDDAAVFKEWFSERATETPMEIVDAIPYFRIGKTYKSDAKKLPTTRS